MNDTVVTLAHELAHNLGSKHDEDVCILTLIIIKISTYRYHVVQHMRRIRYASTNVQASAKKWNFSF